MTPEQLAQLSDSIAKLEATVNNLATGIETLNVLTPRFGGAVRNANLDIDKMREMARRTGETLEEYTARLEELTALQIAKAKADAQEAEAKENLRDAMYSLKTGMNQFKDALLSTERTLGKYSGALDNAGDAAIDVGKNFGAAGLAVGIVAKGFTTLASAGLKQADAQLKATDALAKVGATGTLTTDQLLDMGHAAGLTSKNLELFTKPLQSMGPALITLGGTTKEAVAAFGDMTAIRKEERQAFQRLGISQEELIQNQADYIKLQRATGVQITDNMRKDGALRRASLEYTENLLQLSAITGKSVDDVKKDQEIARAGYASLIQQNELQRKIREAELNGNTDRAAALRAELAARDKLLDAIQTQIGDPEILAAAQQALATGAITEVSQNLVQLNIPILEFNRRIKEGQDVTADFMDSFRRGVDRNEEMIGKSAALTGEGLGKIFGISSDTLKARAAMGERNERAIRERTAAEIEAGKREGLDAIKDARATFTEAEIVLQKGVDNIVQTLNPLKLGFGLATAAAGALAIAAYFATNALQKLAVTGLVNNAAESVDLPGGPGRGGRLGGLLRGGTTLAKFGGAAAGLFSVAGGISTAMSGSKEADLAVAEGRMTDVQAEQAKEEAKYTGGGEAIGGVIGGALGMMAGPLGAAIGGTLGSKLGGFLGGWIAKRDDEEKLAEDTATPVEAKPAGPPPTLEDLRDAQRIASEQKDQTAALKAFNERLRVSQTLGTPSPGTTAGQTVGEQIVQTAAPVTEPEATEPKTPVVETAAPAAVVASAAPVVASSQIESTLQGFNPNDYPEQLEKYYKEELEKSGFDDARARQSARAKAELRMSTDFARGNLAPETAIAAPITTGDQQVPKPETETKVQQPQASEEQQQQKSWFERNKNTISGMALGILGGPLGIMAGGLIGRHLDTKLETKREELKPQAAKQDEDTSKVSEEAFRLANSFRNLSASLDIATRNVVTLDKNFDEINFAMEEMVSDLTGEGDQRSPGEAMASDFKSAFTVAMIDLKRLANRASFSTGDSSTSDSAQAGGGGGTAGGTSTAEPALASRGSSGGAGPTGTEPGMPSGVSVPDFAQGRPGSEKPIAKVVDAGPGFTTVQTDDGTIQKREGVRNWRNNNPGNLEYGRFAKSKDAVGSDGRFAVFPTLEDGMEAKRDLIFGNRYLDLSIAQAISKYAPPHENDTNMYIRQIMEATGASSHTLLRELSGSQRDSMLSAINRVEGFKPGKIIEGALGGIATGPKTGYPALLHGREAIVPLASNSLLEKMAKTPETQPLEPAARITTTQTVDSPALNKSLQDLTALNAEMMSMMQEKLDEMIDRLGTGNDINKKIYKSALV